MNRRSATIFLLLAISLVAAGASAAEVPVERRAGDQLESLRVSTGTPAVSAAVARGGEIVFTWSSGLADVERRAQATPDTVYNVGSVSKAITAVAVAQLVESRKVSLSDPIQRYVPSFPDKGAAITVWSLLTHTSGIRHYRIHDFPGPDWAENHRPYASIAEAARIFAGDRLLFPPGKYYFYSSYGVDLLQGVIESASGLPLERYLREHVFEPAGMQRSALDVAGREVANRARGYETKGGRWVATEPVDVSYKYAGGGMLSTAPDLVRLAAALNHGRLLGDAGLAELFKAHLPVVRRFQENGPVVTERFRQALLWRLVSRSDGHDFAYECGTFNGFNACVLDYRAEDLVVAIATNSEAIGYKPAESLAALFRAKR